MKLSEFEKAFKIAITQAKDHPLTAKKLVEVAEQKWFKENGSKPPYELIRS